MSTTKHVALQFSFVIVFVLWGSLTGQAQSQVFIGAKTGLDAGVCSVAAPCRNVDYALTQVAAGGEINLIESGDYAPTIITKAVTVQAAPGILATFSAAVGPLVTINAGNTDVVRLRGLTLDGQGSAARGVSANTAAAVQIDGLVVTRFTSQGIVLNNNNSRNAISNTSVMNCNVGIVIGATTGGGLAVLVMQATLENCQVERCQVGYSAAANVAGNLTVVTIRNSSANHCTTSGFNGVVVNGTVRLTLENILAAHNATGVQATLNVTTRASNSTIVINTMGLNAGGGSLLSRLNNTVEGNTTNGTFTGTFTAK